jgi:cob(I)alamin adenosyltransferase
MVKLNKIYTRTGDDGTTGLVSGERRPKYDLRIEAYGTVDETNAVVGTARLHTADMPELDAMLMRIQNDCFDLGADLATPETGEKLDYEPLRIVDAQVDRIEADIDRLNADLEPLKSFVLPGGTAASAHLHSGPHGIPPCRTADGGTCSPGQRNRQSGGHSLCQQAFRLLFCRRALGQ